MPRLLHRWIGGLVGLWLAGCQGPQSALAPAGRAAERIADLFWWMAAGAVVIWLAVVSLAIYVIRVRPEPHGERLTSWLIIGGGGETRSTHAGLMNHDPEPLPHAPPEAVQRAQ